MRIIPLSEGSFAVGKNKIFTPLENLQADTKNSDMLAVEVQPFCIVLERDIILIDTGLGFEKGGKPQLITNLAAHGIAPTDVTKVLLSHLHKDHAGGVSYMDTFGHHKISFPNAVYFLQRREYDYAEETGYPAFITEEFEVFDTDRRVFWLHDDEGIIDNYIEYKRTGAHSPHHTVYWIKQDGQTIFYGGDDAPQYKQMISRFAAKYDYDGKKAMELRQQWWDQGRQEGWIFLFYHDMHMPFKKASV